MSKLGQFVSKSELTIFCSPNAKAYSGNLVQWILNCFSTKKVIQTTSLQPYPDICIVHITERINVPNKSFLLLISGEPWILQNRIDMMIGPCTEQNADISLYYPFLYSSLYERRVQSIERKQKKFFCAFMYFRSYPHRDRYFTLLSLYKKVIALGKACSSKDGSGTRFVNNEHETYNDIAVNLYSSFRFVLAIENTWKEGYFTEKIINPIMAHSVPLYWGHPCVFEYINKKRVIYLPEFTDEQLITYLDTLTEEQYQSILDEPTFTEKGKPEVVDSTLQLQLQQVFQ